MTPQEAAEKWNVSLRWVQRLCKENHVEGALNITPAVKSCVAYSAKYCQARRCTEKENEKYFKKSVRFFEVRSLIGKEVRKWQVLKKNLRKYT